MKPNKIIYDETIDVVQLDNPTENEVQYFFGLSEDEQKNFKPKYRATKLLQLFREHIKELWGTQDRLLQSLRIADGIDEKPHDIPLVVNPTDYLGYINLTEELGLYEEDVIEFKRPSDLGTYTMMFFKHNEPQPIFKIHYDLYSKLKRDKGGAPNLQKYIFVVSDNTTADSSTATNTYFTIDPHVGGVLREGWLVDFPMEIIVGFTEEKNA